MNINASVRFLVQSRALTGVALISLAALGSGCSSISHEKRVHAYPSPGSLEEVANLQESRLFSASVEGEELFVYHGYQPNFNKYGYGNKGGHYTAFAFDSGTARVEVETAHPFESFSVKPAPLSVSRLAENRLVIEFASPSKVLLTTVSQGGEEQWLVLAADGPEAKRPRKDDPSVLYLEAGVHRYGRAWDPFVDGVKTLYLEPGAVVEATLRVVGKEGLSILGRGLFAQGFRPHGREEDPLQTEWQSTTMGAYFRDCRDLRFEGFAVINSPSYQLEVADCDRVRIQNLKLLGFGWNNNDGMHLYSRDVEVDDCFIAGNDDRICITGLFDSEDREIKEMADQKRRITGGPVENIRIRNCVFWGHRNGGDIMLTWNGSHTCSDVLIENCHSLTPTNKGFLTAMHGGSVVIKDVTIRNIDIHHNRFLYTLVRDAKTWGDGGGAIDGLLVEDVRIQAEPEEVEALLTGWSEESAIRNVTFRNVTANGERIESFDQTSVETNEYLYNVTWE